LYFSLCRISKCRVESQGQVFDIVDIDRREAQSKRIERVLEAIDSEERKRQRAQVTSKSML